MRVMIDWRQMICLLGRYSYIIEDIEDQEGQYKKQKVDCSGDYPVFLADRRTVVISLVSFSARRTFLEKFLIIFWVIFHADMLLSDLCVTIGRDAAELDGKIAPELARQKIIISLSEVMSAGKRWILLDNDRSFFSSHYVSFRPDCWLLKLGYTFFSQPSIFRNWNATLHWGRVSRLNCWSLGAQR